MKGIIRRVFVNTLSLFLVSLFLPGLSITGGFVAFLYAGVLLSVISIFIDPIVKFVTLPFNLLTLGFLSFLTILVSLIIVMIIDPNVHVANFTFQGISILGFEVKRLQLSGILPIIAISVTIYILNRVVDFIFTE